MTRSEPRCQRCGGVPQRSIRYRGGRVGLCDPCLDAICDQGPGALRRPDVMVYYECRAARARREAHRYLERTCQWGRLAAARQGNQTEGQE